ncbi:2-methylcitrate dehydratase PrpD [Neobacillus niacini]|uniref:MmgE/PrpD family protein n=1 Tax=Neobacillus niacini TaxID=86668 RepID=UPI00285ADC01|nr:MmgE/PrpD family protein [Neobacillus niacini]MDR7076043.1 2-methylcitrate dehydratase PrpD [Neobacillus niacini]
MKNAEKIAKFITGINYDVVPLEVKEKLKTILLHNLSIGIADNSSMILAQNYLKMGSSEKSTEATIFFNGSSTTAPKAALINAIMFHSRAQDDIQHSCGTHIGCIVIPAALAIAESKRSNGKDFLRAILAAYEVTSYVGNEFSKATTLKGFRASGIYGPIGAATVASILYHLNEEQTASALSLAANFSSGLNQTWIAGTSEYQLQTAMASMHGVLAAQLVLAGFNAAPDTFEGSKGFYNAYTGEPQNISDRLDSLGNSWDILNVTLKPYPVCTINQVPVIKMMEIIQNNNINAKNIKRINITMNEYEAVYPGVDNQGPFNSSSATLMSIQFSFALAILYKTIRVDLLQLTENEEILKLTKKIEVSKNEELPRYSSIISISLNDDRNITVEINQGEKLLEYGWDRALQYITNIKNELMITPRQFDNLIAEIEKLEFKKDIRQLIKSLSTESIS